jgi:hypothetical protein
MALRDDLADLKRFAYPSETIVSNASSVCLAADKGVSGKVDENTTLDGCDISGLFALTRHDRHDEAVEIVNRALDLGVNYIDTSAWYGTGASELNIGTVMRERREEVFLASKSHDSVLQLGTKVNQGSSPRYKRVQRLS